MPLKRFWLLSKTIDRLTAEEDIRQLDLLVAAQSGEAMQKLSDRLRKQVGDVAVFEAETGFTEAQIDAILNVEPEPGAFEKLRGLARAY